MKLKSKLKNRILRSIRLAALTGAVTMYSAVAMAAVANDALPTGGQFMGTGHGGSIMSANGVMNVNQNTSSAAIKWETFNVGANATINFNMNGKQDGTYNILNYSANGGNASEIFGRMKASADAHVWLVNPNGVLIGKGAQIDVGHMHMATHKLTDAELNSAAAADCQTINNSILKAENHTAAELMSMGNLYVNSISFDGDRVVVDADKLYTYAGDKVELGEKGKLNSGDPTDHMVHKVDDGGNMLSGLVDRVYMGENSALKDVDGNPVSNNTGDYAKAAAAKGGNTWTGDALNTSLDKGNSYLTIGKHAKEVVVGYTVYDEKATGAYGGKGTYENSANWRALYTTLDGKGKSERVGFAWVEDSKQLERIGEGTQALSRDFALKDGIAAIATQEYNSGAGFQPIGNETTAFTGKFDGLTYDIYGLTINRPDENDIGLFGHVGNGAVIRNVNLVSGYIVGNENVGGVVGHAVGNVTLQNVVNSSRVLGVNNVGGIIGKAEGTSASAAVNIINAENVALIRGNTNVGGIGGNISNTTITGESYNTGAVRGIVNYKVADSAYASKKAFELTSAKYAVDGGYSVGSQVVYKVGSVEKVAFVKTLDFSGNPASYVDKDGNDVTSEALNATRLLVRIEAATDKGTSNMDNASKKEYKNVFEARGSHDVGGLVGTGKNVAIGNEKDPETGKLFEIYNGIEIQGGYNIAGIAGSIAKADGGSNVANVIQNVVNRGNIVAKGFDSEAYYYQSRFYANGTNVSAYVNASDTNMNTLNNTYYGEETLKDSDWVKGNYMKQTVAVANVGGIVGLAEGSAAAVTNIKNVSNYADVKSDTKTEAMTIVKYDTSLNAQVATDYETTYSLGGNVGGIVGKATSGTISGVNTNSNRNGVSTSSGGGTGVIVDYATNKENFVLGAHNVGGIVGYGFNATVKNSVNDGGDISMTGARNQDQFTSVIGRYANGLNMWDYGFSHEISRGTVVQQTMYADYVTGNVGGVMGYMLGDDSYVENSRNRGYIHTQDLEKDGVRRITNEAANVGGIVGKVGRSRTLNWDNTTLKTFNDTTKVAIKSSSNEGKVSGYSGIGGVVGQMYNGEIMTSKNLGNIVSSFAQNSFNEQANMGGILGDTPAGAGASDSASIKIYDSFNEGVIGDPTFETYGRHVGGVVGRLLGEVSKAYNVGDLYTGSDNIGGIAGYIQTGGVYNVYNKGNITNYVESTSNNGFKIGGIVGRFENSGDVNDAYNLGVIRSFIDNKSATDVKHVVGGIIAENGSANNVYSTGEIYAAHTNGSGEWVKSSNQIGGIKPGGGGISNYRVVLAEDPSLWSLTDSASADYTIEYKNRYNINEWTTRSQALQNVVKEDTTDNVINRTDSKFRMYLYDKADGVSVTYGANSNEIIKAGVTYTLKTGTTNVYEHDTDTITVVGSMPILNKYVPYVYGGYDTNTPGYLGNKIGTDIKYIQVGTEYNPLQLNVVMNTPGATLDIDYATAEMSRAAHINVQNGNLNIHNINNADFFLAGNYVALNGNVTVAGSAERFNISSNTNIVGKNANIINLSGSIENNATVTSTAGDVTVQGKGITNYGSITALGKDDASVIVKGVSATVSSAYSTADKTTTEVNALKAKINNPNVQLNNKGVDVYSSTVDAPSTNGNIEITTKIDGEVTGDVNLYLGNNKLGKIATEGNLTITGDNVYSDADYRMGYGEHASTKWTVNGNDIVLDFSNMAATVESSAITQDLIDFAWTGETVVPKPTAGAEFTPAQREVLKRVMLHHMVSDFSTSNTKGNEIAFAGTDGTSVTKAMLVMSYFDDKNVLDLNRYDAGATKLFDSLATLDVKNGGSSIDATTIAYAWVENAEQLLGIQKAFEGDAAEYARINELKAKKQNGTITGDATSGEVKELNDLLANHEYNTSVMAMNYALKNDIDASDLAHFISLGLKADGTDTAYTGTFDGRDHDLNSLSPSGEVEGVKVDNSTGLFSTIGSTGTVKDLFINSSQLVANSTRVGLIAGTNEGTVKNVRTYGNTVKDANTVTNNPVFIGGLVGFNAESGKIINSVSEDIVYAENEKGQADVGGIVGLNAGIVYESTGKSDVSVADGGATSLGGVAGVNAGVMSDIVALGVTAGLYEHGDGTFTGALNVGGIAGENRTVYDTKEGVKHTDGSTRTVTYTLTDENGNELYTHTGGGVIADAYNDSKVKGWSNTGGIVGKNFGKGDSLSVKTQSGVNISTDAAADMFYVANAADVIAGENAGGLAGVNNGSIKGIAANVVVTDINGNEFTYKVSDNSLVSAKDKDGHTITETTEAKEFYNKYIVGSEEEVSQVIYGRNAGKITAKSGLVDNDEATKKTNGTNVGGLIGISGPKADVDHLLNGKAASVYGKVNVGGLIGLNQGVLQNSVNLMQNNDISGAINVGGIVGENSGIIAKIENTNKFNITVNEDYVKLSDGSLKEDIVYKQYVDDKETSTVIASYTHGTDHASFFGGILGHNAATGTAQGSSAALGGIVADVVNTANVTIEHPANYVGGIMGKNDGTIGYAGMTYNDANDVSHEITGYLRNDGAVGVINGPNKGEYIGGVIGQNNKDIYMVDITNSIKGTVYGYDYVGGIVGQNNAVISGGRDEQDYANKTTTAEKGNYYKYDVYNNGMVTGTTNVGGLIGDNYSTGTIKLAYNTGVVKGTTNVGGVVGSNEGKVDQVFNSTAPYDKDGKSIAAADLGVHGNSNVGGLVGINAGAISNAYNTGKVDGSTAAGSAVGNNAAAGKLASSYATDTNMHLVGKNNSSVAADGYTKGLKDNYSLYVNDDGTVGINYLTGANALKTSSYGKLSDNNWAFYNNASTPLLKNFLTKAYFVPNENFGDAFTYNAKPQGAGIKVEDGHVNVYKVVDGVMTTTKVGEIFAADAAGDHSLADYLMTKGNGGSELIIGNQNGVNADRYDMLYSAQINTDYNKKVVNSDGVIETVVNPNMLGYEFFEAKKIKDTVPYDPTQPIYDPSRPDYIPNPSYDPGNPSSPQIIPNPDKNPTDAVKPEDTNPKIPTGTDFELPDAPKSPTYDINKAIIKLSANDVEREYGSITLTGDKYKSEIDKTSFADGEYNKLKDYLELTIPTDNASDTNYSTLAAQDGAITGNKTVAVTANVGDYKWESHAGLGDITSASPEVKELLKNYVFDTAPSNEAERNALKALQQKYDVIDLGDGKAVGKSTVTPVTLTITVDPVANITYGSAAGTYTSTVTGNVNGDAVNDILTYNTINQAYYTAADQALDSSHVAGHTKNVGTYDVVAVKATEESKYNNYNIVYNKKTVDITPAVLEVQVNNVTREYGDATMTPTKYYEQATGWVYGEDLSSGITLQGTISDGALAAPNSVGKITNDAGDYTWSGKLVENLDNYVLKVKGTADSTIVDGSLNIGANSKVTPKHINVELNSFNIVYGARLDDANGDNVANEHHLYGAADEHVYTDNVNSLYKVKNTGFVNGDSADDVIESINYSGKAGFADTQFVAGQYDTKIVGDYDYVVNKTDVTVSTNSKGNKNYIIDDVTKGTVTVKHAIIEAQAGGDIYRYYGEGQKYVLNGTTLNQIDNVAIDNDNIKGNVYGQNLSSKLHVDHTAGTPYDNALGTSGKVTQGVGVYTWGGGKIYATNPSDFDTKTDVLYNYRFWDENAHDVTTTATTITGGASYVLPQIIDVKLKDQEIVYGTAYSDAQAAYKTGSIIAENGITGTSKGGTNWQDVIANGKLTFNGVDFEIGDDLSNINANEVVYTNYDNGAYNGIKTNDVKKDSNGNIIAYNDAVSVTGGTSAGAKLVMVDNYSDFVKYHPGLTTGKYLAAAGNSNYALRIADGDVKITPKQITMSDLASTITYGDAVKDDYSKLTNVTGGVLDTTKIAYSTDNVVLDITNKAIVNGNGYHDNRDGRNTGDAGIYAGALQANVALTGAQAGNYMLVDTIGDNAAKTQVTGTLTVNKADLVINLNDFKVLYGDTKDSQTINDNYKRNEGDDNKVSAQETVIKSFTGLVNGDAEAGIKTVLDITGVKDTAFKDYGGTIGEGTVDVSTGNKLYATGVDKMVSTTTSTVDGVNVITGGETKNYNVTVNAGNVDVLAKQVVVIDPGKDVPTKPTDPSTDPFDPTKDDSKEKFNPDAVYVNANDVERTYGSTDITKGEAPKVTITGLAKWDSDGTGTKEITPAVAPAHDGGLDTTTTTNNAGDYKWDTTIGNGTDGIKGLGENYIIPTAPTTTSVKAEGNSKVNRAKLTIKLGSVSGIEYGTAESTVKGMSDYNSVTVVTGADNTTYGTANGLAVQDATKKYTDLFTYDDQNTGYIGGVGQAVTSDGTTPITYHHNAINASGEGVFTVTETGTTNTNFNNPYDNKATTATGISIGGNYDVTIINGNVDFKKATLKTSSNPDIVAEKVVRTYGDTEPTSGGYEAAIKKDSLASWDQQHVPTGQDKLGIEIDPIADTGLTGVTGSGETFKGTGTNNVGNSYTWTGEVDMNVLPDWIKNNYYIGDDPTNASDPTKNKVSGNSAVNRAELVIQLDNFHSNPSNSGTTHNPIIYGTEESLLNAKYPYSFTQEAGKGLAQQDIDAGITINAGSAKDLLTFAYNNTGYNGDITKPVGDAYKLQAQNVAGSVWTKDTASTENVIKGTTRNYNVTIKAGDVEIVKREVTTYDPTNPGPNWPVDPTDPTKPWDPTSTDPSQDPNNPSSPFNPKNDPTYDPTNPDDPRNQMLITTNVVERTYGNTTITKTSDGKPGYGFDVIYGASGFDPNKISLGTVSDTAKTSDTTTDNVGSTYIWSAGITSTDPGFANFDVPTAIVGGSKVNKATLNVYLNDMSVQYGDDYALHNTYYFVDGSGNTINGTDTYLNGDTYDSIIKVNSLDIKNGAYNETNTKTLNAGTENLFNDALAVKDESLKNVQGIENPNTNHDQATRYLYGESASGNYDVYVHSGKVDITKRKLTYTPVNATVEYNDTSLAGGKPDYKLDGNKPVLTGVDGKPGIVYNENVELHSMGVAVKAGSEYAIADDAKTNSTTAAVKRDTDGKIIGYNGAILHEAELIGDDFANYELVEGTAGTITVTPKELKVSDFKSTIIYGEQSVSSNFNITDSGELKAVHGAIASGDDITLDTTAIQKNYKTGSEYADAKGSKNTPDVKVIVDHNKVHTILDYEDSLNVTNLKLNGDDAGNYKFVNAAADGTGSAGGTIKVLPRKLDVTTNEITRVYGQAEGTINGNKAEHTLQYVNVTGWADGETGLVEKLVVENLQDGAVTITNPKEGQVTNNKGTYEWNATLHSYEALHNYTFDATQPAQVEQIAIKGGSIVTPVNFDIKLNNITMIYGATEGQVGSTATTNAYYTDAGQHVLETNVAGAYGFDLNFLVNGDKLIDVIGMKAEDVVYNNTGFKAGGKTDNVGTGYTLSLADEADIRAAIASNPNYSLKTTTGNNGIQNGTVEIKHALLTAGGETVYRYYGDSQMYHLVEKADGTKKLEETDKYKHSGLTGFVYNENDHGELDQYVDVHIEHPSGDFTPLTDTAVAGKADNQKTNAVRTDGTNYYWSDGYLSIKDGEETNALKNYRIFDVETGTVVTEVGHKATVGGVSVVLPQEITLTLKDQTIFYGTSKEDAMSAYDKNIGIKAVDYSNPDNKGKTDKLVNGDSSTIATLAGNTFEYVNGQAYVGDKTNNVKRDSNGNLAAYEGAVELKGNLVSGTDEVKLNNLYTGDNYTYTTFAGNKNYIVKVEGGDVTIAPKQVTVEKFSGTITYGDERGNDGILTHGGVKLDGILEHDNVTLKPGTLLVTGDYEKNRTQNGATPDRKTADVGTYNDSLIKGVGLVGDEAGNYVLVDKVDTTYLDPKATDEIKGSITVNPAELTVYMNNFNVIYGMEKDSKVTVNGQEMTVAEAERGFTFKPADLLNGDKIQNVLDNGIVTITSAKNDAFETKSNGVVGTKEARDEAYGLTPNVNGTTLVGAQYDAANGITTGGSKLNVNNKSNYIVHVVDGSVTVDRRPVVVIPPNQNVPKPGDNDWNPNVVYVQANTVERTYGNTTPDKPYQVTVEGAPSWDMDKIHTTITNDKVHGDTGMHNGDVGSDRTNVVGDAYQWNTNVDSVIGGLGSYELPNDPHIVGVSKVNRAELVVKIQDTVANIGEKFDAYDFVLDGLVNGDDKDKATFKNDVLVLGGNGYNNPHADADNFAIGTPGHYAGQLGFKDSIAGKELQNYTIKYTLGDITVIDPNRPDPSDPVEDLYPWLHRTNNDHGWGHQEHWRERKAEVNYVEGGADFFNDATAAEAADDEALKS